MMARSATKNPSQALRDLAHVFYALKDVVRLEMLSVLAEREECTVNELAEALNKSQPLISWHLRRLKAAGLVKIRRSGREVYCSISSGYRDSHIH
jgi:DNA-binding transcriptional ArsR family regulator